MNFFNKKNKGFTLIEIMVAVSIFSIVMIVAIGGLLVTSNSAKKARALRTAMDSVNFAMEEMSRSLRLGYNYTCLDSEDVDLLFDTPADCLAGKDAIIYSFEGLRKAFKLSEDYSSGRKIVQKVYNDGEVRTVDLTPSEVNITSLKFFVNGTDPLDQIQPSVYIMMKGEVSVNNEVTNFAIQTLVSQRDTEL